MIRRLLTKSSRAAIHTITLFLAAVAYPQCNLIVNDPPCNAVSTNLTLPSVTAGSPNIGTLTYWLNPNATVPLPNPNAVTASGLYYIKNTVGACSDVKPVKVTIGTTAPTATPFLHTECSAAGTTPNSIFFDFNGVGQTSFNWSYTVDGGPPISGTQVAPTSHTVTGLSPGQKVVYTISFVGVCTPPLTTTAYPKTNMSFALVNGAHMCLGDVLPTTDLNGIPGSWNEPVITAINGNPSNYVFTPGQCGNPITFSFFNDPRSVPVFNNIGPYCQGAAPAPVLPTTSSNGIQGTWSPATVNTATVGSASYTFTPNAGQCADPVTINIAVNAGVTASFSGIPTTLCQNAAYTLPSTNNGVAGGWTPTSINTATTGTKTATFTPTAGQPCVSMTPINVSINVVPNLTPTFNAIAPFCAGSTPPVLPASSIEGIAGTWNPPTVSNTASGSYTFTPTSGQCALSKTISITVTPNVVPNFQNSIFLCSGSPAPVLNNTSPNGITGTWNPPTISNTVGGNYVFTPSAGQCASTQTLVVGIIPRISPDFASTMSLCVGSSAPALATTSPNGISGSWTPSTINTSTPGVSNYVFTAAAGECVVSPTHTLTVTVNAITPPNFAPIAPICFGSTPPVLSNTAPNGVVGNWSPATISNTTSASYTFTPLANQCSTTQVLNVTVKPNVTPNFAPSISLCSGAAAPALLTTSPNGISGTWTPATISNTTSGSYVFTPTPGQCASGQTINVTITPRVDPDFQSTLSVCVGTIPPALNATSPNGVSGTWSPASINTTTPGVTNYVFTAAANECVINPTFVTAVTITPVTTPDFAPIPAFCEGTPAPVLSNTSPNGVVGTWSPAVISNTTSGSYLFTPLANQCANSQILNVLVTMRTVPTFSPIPAFCEGSAAPVLPLTSNNGITGTWSPSTVDNMASGTYLFTPDAPQCATTATLDITVTTPISPGFSDIEFCENAAVIPVLEPTSPLGITGTWNPAVIDPTVSGATYEFTPDAGECATSQTISVTVNELTLNDVTWVVSNYFSESATVTFTATDAGNYLYQLDDGPAVTNNTFVNVAPGTHTITVYDANGCAPPITRPNEVVVIGYPHFFTPNGDGIGDHWNIFDLALAGQSQATIHIFDRYGKLLKQIAPAGEGWDGTYNGQPLPSTDYWFVVYYNELNVPREFKSHFALKR